MNINYDKKLSKISFYEKHPEYLPYIGDNYEKYKILHIGESHYIAQTYDNEKYNLNYFMAHWWNGTYNELKSEYADWYNTRLVVNNYLSGDRKKGHLIFTNVVKEFSRTVLDEEIHHINRQNSQNYNYFAFMNFFQMPSLYKGLKFWNSIEKSAVNREAAEEAWDYIVKVSTDVTDEVIDIIKPNLVVFTSKSAYDAYKSNNESHSKDNYIIGIPHPCCSYWNKSCKEYGNLSGKELFEKNLIKFIR